VLIAHSFYRLAGGEDRYVEQQAELLGRRHTVELFARDNKDLSGDMSTAVRMTYSSSEATRVQRAIARFEPDIVHLHNAYPSLGPAVHLAADRCKVPLVMTVHNFRLRCPNGYAFTEGRPCRRCEKGNYLNAVAHRCFPSRSQAASYATSLWIHRFLLRLDTKVRLFITPSDFVHRRLVEWGISPQRVQTVRNYTTLQPGTSEPGEFGMYLGRLSSEKGLDVLLHALELAGDPPFRVVGDGPLRPALEDFARDLGLRRVEFTGPVPPDNVAPLVRRARFLALPSLWDENAPLAALEAMAAGRPLLVTQTGGLPELVENGEGVTCRAGDTEGLGDNIRTLMADDGLCREIGERALRRARADFTPDVHLSRLENAYSTATR
jgi:glycosyltransferase involved in cell wall biosynthesis